VYTRAGTTVYLQAFHAGRFGEFEYAHMLDPQSQSPQLDRGKWVSFDPLTQPRMHLTGSGLITDELTSVPYLVRQLPGGGLGYEVVRFDPNTMERATFDGYVIDFPNAGANLAIALLDKDDATIPGSQRRLISLHADRAPWLYVLSLLPIAFGLVTLFIRRRQARHIKVTE
jgi:hypothetical protein